MRLKVNSGIATGIFILLVCLTPLLAAQLIDDRFNGNRGQASQEDMAGRSLIEVWTDNSTVHAKLSFINVSYYKRRLVENFPTDPGELYQPGDYTEEEFSYKVVPLNGSLLRFTFDGFNITDSGGDPACATPTDQEGWTECDILYYYDNGAGVVRSFFDPENGPKGCGEVAIYYAGETRNYTSDEGNSSQAIKPSHQSVTLCPPHAPALTAFGSSLSGGIKDNFGICFPALAILGLLLASMYYSGRDPLSLFDITTPRLPATKPFKVTGGTAPMMLRSATKKLIADRQQSRIDVRRLTKSYLDTFLALKYNRGGKRGLFSYYYKRKDKIRMRREMRLELNKLLREHKQIMDDLGSSPENKEVLEYKVKSLMFKFQKFFAKYSPKELGDRDELMERMGVEGQKRYKNLEDMFPMVQKELAAKLAMAMEYNVTKKMFGARARPGGRLKKVVDKAFDKVTDLELGADRLISKVRFPVVGPIVRGVLYAPVRVTARAFDAVAQHRGSSLALWSLVRDLHGAAWYRLGHNSKGEANWLGKQHEKMYSRGAFAKAYAWFQGKKRDEIWGNYVKRYNLNAKQAVKFPTDTIENSMVEDERLLRINLYNAHMAVQLGILLANVPESHKEEAQRIANNTNICAADKINLIIRKIDPSELHFLGIRTLDEKLKYSQKIEEFTKYVRNNLLADMRKGRFYARSERSILDEETDKYGNVEGEQIIGRIRADTAQMDKIRQDAIDELAKTSKRKAGNEAAIQKKIEEILERKAIEEHLAGATRRKEQYREKYEKMAEKLSEEIDSKFTGSKFQDELAKFAETQNRRIGNDLDKRALRLIVVGKHPVAAYLTELLRPILFDDYGELRTVNGRRPELWIAGKKVTRAENFELPDIMEFESLFAKGEGKYRFRSILRNILEEHSREPAVAALLQAIEKENKVMNGKMDDKTKQALSAMRKALKDQGDSLDIDMAMNVLLLKSLDSATTLAAMLKRASEAEEGKANLLDKGNSKLQSQMNWVKKKIELEQASENAATRQSSRTNEYRALEGLGQSIEMLIDANLRATKVIGYAMNWNVKGGFTSESAFAGMSSDFRDVAQQYNGMRAVFLNKITKGSPLYDEKFANAVKASVGDAAFADALQKGTMPFKGYQVLLKNGLTFADLKHIPYLASGDGKGCIPILHSDQKLLDVIYKDDELKKNGVFKRGIVIEGPKVLDANGRVLRDATEDDVKNAKQLKKLGMEVVHDVRDYSSLLADKVVASRYSDLPIGMVLQVRDPANRNKWIMADPTNPKAQNALISMFAEAANTNPNLKAALARSLAGFDENGKFSKDRQQFRVVSNKDYGYEEGKSARRSRILEVVHAGTYDRAEKMNEWYAVQGVLRQVVSGYAEMAKGWTTEGPKRFKIGNKEFGKGESALEIYSNEQLSKMGLSGNGKFEKAMEKLQYQAANEEQGRFRLTMRNFKSEIAGRTMAAIAEAESLAIASNYMKKAIKHASPESLGLTRQEYSELKSRIDASRKEYNIERSTTRKDYKVLNDVVVSWTGSHNAEADYGSKRNLLTRSWAVQNLIDHGSGHPYTMGRAKDFWYAIESATMRSSSSVMGQRFGFGAIVAVALETGQGAYEPAHMWLQSGVWEKHYIPFVAATRVIHMGTIPLFTSIYRGMHGVPSYSRKNEWEGFDMVRHQPYGLLLARGLLRTHMVSDYIKDTKKNVADYTGYSALKKAYIDAKPSPLDEGGVRGKMENRYLSSSHISGDAISPKLQRLLDKGKFFDEKTAKALYADSDKQALHYIQQWAIESDEKKREKERKIIDKYIDDVKSQGYYEYKFKDRHDALLGLLLGNGGIIDIQDNVAKKQAELEKEKDAAKQNALKAEIASLMDRYRDAASELKVEFKERQGITTRNGFTDLLNTDNGSAEESAIWNEIKRKMPKDLIDLRPELIKTARGAGRDFFIDGSRNRFMNLWLPHHENVWRWIVPDLTELDPRGHQNYGPMQANIVRAASQTGTAASHMWIGGIGMDSSYEEATGRYTFRTYDSLNLRGESFRHIYKKGENALFHLLDYQSQMLSYSGLNPYLQFAGSAAPKFLGVSADWLKWKVGGKAMSQSIFGGLDYGETLSYTQSFGSTPEELLASIEHRSRRRDENSRMMAIPLEYYREKAIAGASGMDYDYQDHIYWYERGGERAERLQMRISNWAKNRVDSGLESLNMLRSESESSKMRNTLAKQESFKNMAILTRAIDAAKNSSIE